MRVLFGWELGENSGHLRPYLSLLKRLAEQGWEVAIAQRNTSVAAAELAGLGFPVFQAPVCLNAFTGIAPVPASHAEIYLGFGYAHPETLTGLVGGWRAILTAWRADLVIANYAPTLVLAAHSAGIPAVRLGTGFDCPPHQPRSPLLCQPTPEIDERVERAEALALRNANSALRTFGSAPVPHLGAVLEGAATLLATIPALDPFSKMRSREIYLGALPAPLNAEAGDPPAVFASLRRDHPHASKLVDALAGGGRRAWVYLPDATEAQCVSASSGSLRVSRQPFNIATALSSHPAVVSYGGHGLGLTALMAGCPQLLLPVNGEQQSTAKRLAELGVGICVGHAEPKSKVVAGLARVMEDEKIAASARSKAEALREFSPDRALDSAIDACCLAAAASRDVPGLARRH
jgi:UDP:flavonoid glycosyltransferase YjiC (YdhE family)